jgi:cytochrome P450
MHTSLLLASLVPILFCYYKLATRKSSAVANLPAPPRRPIFGHLLALLDSERLLYYFEYWACELGELYQFDLLFSTVVVVTSPLEISKMLKQRPDIYHKPKSFQNLYIDIGVKGLFAQESHEWKHSRKMIAPAFSPAKLKQMNTAVIKHILQFRNDLFTLSRNQAISVLEPFKPSQLDDCFSLFSKLAFTIFVGTTFGTSGDLMTPEFAYKGKVAFAVINERLDQSIPLHKFYRKKRDLILEEFFEEMDLFIRSLIVQYRNGKEDFKGTLFQTLLEAQGEDKGDEILLGNLKSLLVAGYETTANSVQSMLRLLIQNPKVLKKVQKEVDFVLGSDPCEKDFYSHSADDFPYCHNVVKEVFRLYPPTNHLYLEAMQEVEVNGISFDLFRN